MLVVPDKEGIPWKWLPLACATPLLSVLVTVPEAVTEWLWLGKLELVNVTVLLPPVFSLWLDLSTPINILFSPYISHFVPLNKLLGSILLVLI